MKRRSPRTALLPVALLLSCTAEDPQVSSTFPGLTEEVEILVDDMGIPHVYAATDADASFAAGYMMATDRLFQMDLTLRRAQGRRAEVLGPRMVGQDKLARMVDFPRWGRKDVEQMRRSRPEDFSLVVAWVAGVNRRIEEVRSGEAPLPYGFGPGELDYMPEPWQLEDALTVGAMLAFGNDETMQNELLATVLRNQLPEVWESVDLLRPMYPVFSVPPENRPSTTSGSLPAPRLATPGATLPMPPEEAAAAMRRFRETMEMFDEAGSNNWALSGSLTANGRPLIAGDPHQGLDSPSLFYTQHINSADRGGSLDVMGWSFVGAPAVHIGFNRNVVWTATSNYGDVVDIWEVSRDGTGIRLGDEVLPLSEREERIRVREQSEDGTLLETHAEMVYRVTDVGDDYGILLDDSILPSSLVTTRPNSLLLLKWTGFDGTNMGSAWLGMNRAKSVDEVEEAVLSLRSGSFNFITADRENILYRVGLDVPDRGDPGSRSMPWTVVDGNDPATVWTGAMLPPEMTPHGRNPARGWLSTANNDPWGFTVDGVVENDPWYYGSFFAAGYRARRIEDELGRLAERGGVTVEDMQALQLDTQSTLAGDVLPMLETAWSQLEADEALAPFRDREDLATLVQVLRDWDGRMERDRPGALVFHLATLFATARTLSDDLDFLFDTILGANAPYLIKVAVLAMQGVYSGSADIVEDGTDFVLLTALADAASLLTERFGGVDPSLYTWGDVHGTYFGNTYGGRLEYGFVPTDGGEDTVNVSGSRFIRGGGIAERFEARGGAIYRMVASFGEDGTPSVQAHFPIGNSGDPDSPHWDDMVDDWADGIYHPLAFHRSEVEARAEQTIRLTP